MTRRFCVTRGCFDPEALLGAGKLSMTMSCFFVFEFALFYVVLFTIATSTMLSVNSKRTKKV
jgi:hypothetical protein